MTNALWRLYEVLPDSFGSLHVPTLIVVTGLAIGLLLMLLDLLAER